MERKGYSIFRKVFFAVILWGISGGFRLALAECSSSDPNFSPAITFVAPAQITLAPDTPVGTVIYEGEVEGASTTLDCNSSAKLWEGYTVLTDAENRDDILPGVYKTNVPGIGIRAARSETPGMSFTQDNLIRPWHYVGSMGNWSDYNMKYHIKVALVVIGEVQSGLLDTSQLIADVKMGSFLAAELRFNPVNIQVVVNTCSLANNNINVQLKKIATQDFEGAYSDILTDSNFKIEIANCTPGTQVDYQFKSVGSTGVTGGNILTIENDEGAASGVGIQILDKNNTVLSFDQEYNAFSSTPEQPLIDIPLKARYVKTGDVKGGQVNAVATFEIYYR